MARWRTQLFAFLQRNANSSLHYFQLPANRVVELGSQVQL
jgi:KUP system potassium uptake protein